MTPTQTYDALDRLMGLAPYWALLGDSAVGVLAGSSQQGALEMLEQLRVNWPPYLSSSGSAVIAELVTDELLADLALRVSPPMTVADGPAR